MQSKFTIARSLTDKNLLGAALGDSASWANWLTVLKATFALPMSETDRDTFAEIAGGREPPSHPVRELWAVVGRRSGKTRIAAAIAVHIGAIEQHKLAPGETGFVLLLAASKSQAQVAFGYVKGFLESSPILRQQIESMSSEEIKLRGNVIIGVHAGSYRTIRGRSLLAVVGDETSFWRDETSATPDLEIFRACAPALAATKGVWIGISTGYRKLGLLYNRWRDHFGHDSDDVLVVQGSSQKFNPSLSADMIQRASAADPEAAESEWRGGFRADISAFLDDQTIERAIDYSRPMELPPQSNIRYSAFTDVSGGRHDAFTLAIGHKDKQSWIADVIRGRHPPFDPENVVLEYVTLLREYRITSLIGDNYSGAWAETAFKKSGIKYIRSEQPKSKLYLESLPLWMRNAILIPDHPRLVRELRLLERRTSRVGQDVVDHGRGGSDDFANSVVGACVTAIAKSGPVIVSPEAMSWARERYVPNSPNSALRRFRKTGATPRSFFGMGDTK
jgi:hypothetical protein